MVIRNFRAGCLRASNQHARTFRIYLNCSTNRDLQRFVDPEVGTFIASDTVMKSITEIVLHNFSRLPDLFAIQLL